MSDSPLDECPIPPDSYYRLPFYNVAGWRLSKGNWDDPNAGHNKGDQTGLQAFAYDFDRDSDGDNISEEGQIIAAARRGTVYAAVESEVGNATGAGNPPGYKGVGNFLVIRQDDNTYAVYWHIIHDGILVKVGDKVRRGDAIAISGNTGNSFGPHVHFDVRTGWDLAYPAPGSIEYKSIMIRFQDTNHTCWRPKVGEVLMSNNVRLASSCSQVASRGLNRLDVFGIGTDNQMMYKSWTGSNWHPSPTEWKSLGGRFQSPPVAVAWESSILSVFGLDNRGKMQHSHLGTTWETLGGRFKSLPSVAYWGSNRLDIFGLGTDKQMYYKKWDGAWYPSPTDWEPLGGLLTSRPSAVAWGSNRLDIFAIGDTDKQMYHKAWDGSNWRPSDTDWNPLGGVFTSPPAAVAWGLNRLDIFGLGTDKQMYHKAWDGVYFPSETDWEPLGGEFSAF